MRTDYPGAIYKRADNGVLFTFSLWHGNLCVDADGRPHMEITNVHADQVDSEIDSFLDIWNTANPRR